MKRFIPLILLILLSAIQANIPVSMFEIAHLAPGIAVFGLAFMTLFSATLIAKDRQSSLMHRLYTTPMRPADFILGYTLPLLPIALAEGVVTYLVAAFLGLTITGGVLLSGVLLSVLLSVALVCASLSVLLSLLSVSVVLLCAVSEPVGRLTLSPPQAVREDSISAVIIAAVSIFLFIGFPFLQKLSAICIHRHKVYFKISVTASELVNKLLFFSRFL